MNFVPGLAALLAFSMFSPSSLAAPAELYGYKFTGTIDRVFGDPLFGVTLHLGDKVSGHFIYGPDVVDMNSDPAIGNYYPDFPNRLFMKVGGMKFENEGEFRNVVWNNYELNDAFSVFDNSGEIKVNGVTQPGQIELQLYDRSTSSFASDAVPASLNLANFNFTFGEVATSITGRMSGVTFTVDSLAPIAVPEPGTIVIGTLLGLAISLSSGRAKRRRAA